jgi:hypothetical protein
MKTWTTNNDAGDVSGFEISNLFIGRFGIARVLRNIDGVEVTKSYRLFRNDGDDFVHFSLNGYKFLVIEPFGDNSRYWIVAENPPAPSELKQVRQAFESRRLGGLLNGLFP